MKKPYIWAVAIVLSIVVVIGFITLNSRTGRGPNNSNGGAGTPSPAGLQKVVINEALRTLLYLPLYHAVEKGYFREAGLDVEIVTGGTATNAFAAMLSGEAAFAQADPMYVPISREKGSNTKVVAQAVARIAVWGVTLDPKVKEMSAATLRGKTISTHRRPMTAYTYTVKRIREVGLVPDKDVRILQSKPGTEIGPLLNKQANYAVTLEPTASQAVTQGAHVVLSYPRLLGDQIFTGLMAREDYIQKNRTTVVAVVRAYQKSINDIRANSEGGLQSAKKYFPQLKEPVLRAALKRIIDEQVLPKSVVVSEESWKKAIAVRVKAGDLKSASPRAENCELDIMQEVSKN